MKGQPGLSKNAWRNRRNVIIASHVRPDGDAIGSLLGLGLALRDAGKSVQMVLVDGVPSSFKHLEGSELIVKEPTGEYDTFITVDSADFKRVGKPSKILASQTSILIITRPMRTLEK